MTRQLYALLLWLHPPAFRRRFGDEMLSIFDEREATRPGLAALLDGAISCVRQWLLRTSAWRIPAVLCGAFVQVWGFGYHIQSNRGEAQSHQVLAPGLNEVLLLALALTGSLLVLVLSVVLWTASFQRRRSLRPRSRLGTPAQRGWSPIHR